MPAIRQMIIATPTGIFQLTIMTAANAPIKPMTEPTERSILPPTMTSNMPRAMMMI